MMHIRWIIHRNTNGRIKTQPVDTETLNRMSWNFSKDSFFSITYAFAKAIIKAPIRNQTSSIGSAKAKQANQSKVS